MEVKVQLENKDIGYVREGMTAEVKIHTFPFTRYGVVEGEVVTVSDDTVIDKKKGLVYITRIKMAKNTILANGRDVNLSPGKAVTAEVQTDKRKLIEFFLAPLIRSGKESLRER